MIEEHNNPGYIPETIPQDSAIYDFVFGAAEGPIRASRDWRNDMMPRKRQYWWPFCVTYSRIAAALALAKINGLDLYLSRLVLGVQSGTGGYWHGQMGGNTLEQVSETFRKNGDVKSEVWEFTDYQLTHSGEDVWDSAFKLPAQVNSADKYKGGAHSWVLGRAAMVDALDHSPLQVAMGIGETWENNGIVQAPKNINAYHAVTVAYIDGSGNMYIQDSIGREWKTLAPDYPLTGIKSFRDLPDNWKELNQKGQLMEILQIIGEQTLVLKTADGKYHVIATEPELYPFVASQLGLAGQTFGIVAKAVVDANFGGYLKAGLTFVSA